MFVYFSCLLTSLFVCLFLSVYVFTYKSSCASICKYNFLFFCLTKFFPVFVCLSMLVCLFGCCSVPVIIFAKCLYWYCKFWLCNVIFIFINHHPSSFISHFHPSIVGEFKTMSSSGMVYAYQSFVWVSRLR